MKTTRTSIGRTLVALMLVLVMAFSFAACQDTETLDRLAALEQADADLEKAFNDMKAVTDAAATDAALKAVSAELTALKEAAATKAELEATKTDLAAANTALEAAKTELAADLAAAKAAAIAAAEAGDTELAADLEAKAAALQAKITANETAIADVAADLAALDEEVAALDAATKASIETLEGDIAGLIENLAFVEEQFYGFGLQFKQLKELVNTNKADLAAKDAELLAKVEEHIALYDALLADHNTLKNTVTTLVDAVADLNGKVDNLIGSDVTDFVADYTAASNMLNDPANPMSYAKFYEIKKARLDLIDGGFYAEAVANEFLQKIAVLEFRLARAVGVKQVEDVWAELNEYIATMPQLGTSLDTLMANIGLLDLGTEPTETNIKDLKKIYDLMRKNIPNEITPEQTALYKEIIGAYDNLVKAKAWLDGVYTPAVTAEAAPAKPFVLLGSDAAYKTINDSFAKDYVATYFADDTNNGYYFAEGTAEDYAKAFANDKAKVNGIYDTMAALNDRLAALNALIGVKVLHDYTAFGVTELPLYHNEVIPNDHADLAKWLADNALDVEIAAGEFHNVYTLLGEDKYKALVASNNYVVAMKGIYEKYVKNDAEGIDLIARIAALPAIDALTLTNDSAEVAAIRGIIDAVSGAIKNVPNYDATLDGNYAEMIKAEPQAAFNTAEARIKTLNDAKSYFTGYLAMMKAEIPLDDANDPISFADWDKIAGYKKTLDTKKSEFALVDGVHVDNPDFDDVGIDACYDYFQALYDAYQVMVKYVADLYEKANGIIEEFKKPGYKFALADGVEINKVHDDLYKLIYEGYPYGKILDPNIYLDFEKKINLKTLYDDFVAVINAYTTVATDAETAMADAKQKIADVIALGDAAKQLNKTAQVEAARAAFDTWAAAYLAEDGYTAASDDAAIAAMLKALEGINKYNTDPIKQYAYVTEADYNKFVELEAANAATVAEAAEKVAAIEAKLAAYMTSGIVDEKKITVLATADIKAIYDMIDAYFVTYYGQKAGDFKALTAAEKLAANTAPTDPDELAAWVALGNEQYTVDIGVLGATETAYLYNVDALEVNKPFVDNYAKIYVACETKKAQVGGRADAIEALINALPATEQISTEYATIVANTPAIVDALDKFYADFYNGAENNSEFDGGDKYILAFHKTDAKADTYDYVYANLANTSDPDKLTGQIGLYIQNINDATTREQVQKNLEQNKGLVDTYLRDHPVAP